MSEEVFKWFEDEPDYLNIYLKQDSGRYCTFTCPSCGHSGAHMKMSANTGWCNTCLVAYQCLTLTPTNNGPPEKVDYYCDLQVVR